MTTLTQELLDLGLKLSPAEREKFARLLLDSLDDEAGEEAGEEADEEPADHELREELERRIARYERGEEPTFTLEEVMADLRKQADDRKP